MQGKVKVTKEDKEWAKKVKERDNNMCVVCGSTERLNAHHIIPREIKDTKHNLDNGISLCPKHHRFSFELSAHQNPLAFFVWFSRKYPLRYKKIREKINVNKYLV